MLTTFAEDPAAGPLPRAPTPPPSSSVLPPLRPPRRGSRAGGGGEAGAGPGPGPGGARAGPPANGLREKGVRGCWRSLGARAAAHERARTQLRARTRTRMLTRARAHADPPGRTAAAGRPAGDMMARLALGLPDAPLAPDGAPAGPAGGPGGGPGWRAKFDPGRFGPAESWEDARETAAAK